MPTSLSMIIISDIHSHFEYLDSILNHATTTELLVCLGDVDKYRKFTSEGQRFFEILGAQTKLLILSGNCDPDSLRSFLTENSNWSLNNRCKMFEEYLLCGFGGIVGITVFIRRVREFLHGKKATKELQEKIAREFKHYLYLQIKNGIFRTLPETPEIVKSWKDQETVYYFDDCEIYDFFTKIDSKNKPQIWFTHGSPYDFPESKELIGVSDGSKGLLEAIKLKQPKLVVSGHLHKKGVWSVKNTKCVSTPALEDGYIAKITINNQKITHEFVGL